MLLIAIIITPHQIKEQKRDWGKGFACAGRSKTNDKELRFIKHYKIFLDLSMQ